MSITSNTVLNTNTAPNGFTYSYLYIASGVTVSATGSYPLIIYVIGTVSIRDQEGVCK